MKFLAQNKPEIFEKVVDYIPEYGRWDDLINLFDLDDVQVFDQI